MEKVFTLADRFREQKPLPLGEAVKMFVSVLEDLEFAHSQGLLHGDIKPTRIARTNVGTYKLIDYGLSKLGTPRYMPPEKVQGQKLSPQSDIYSVGVVLYEAVAGRPPFEAGLSREVMAAHVNQPPSPPSSFRPDIPAELDRVILKALAKRPEERFASARQFRDALSVAAAKLVTSSGAGAASKTAAELRSPDRAQQPSVTRGAELPAGRPSESIAPPASRPTRVVPAQPVAQPRPAAAAPVASDGSVRTRRIGRAVWLVPLGVVLGLVVFAVASGGFRVRVPDVVGMPQAEAERLLSRRGLVPVRGGSLDDTVAAGRVAMQLPKAGVRVGRGEKVSVRISTGVVTVPDVVGQRVEAALDRLRSAGLEPAPVESQYSDRFAVGVVIQTEPRPALRVVPHSRVRVVVASGRATCPRCGKAREPGARFCTGCGYKFEEW